VLNVTRGTCSLADVELTALHRKWQIMRYTDSCLVIKVVVALGVAAISAGGCAGEPKAFECPKGCVVVEEDVILALTDQPGNHLTEARKYHENKDWKAAARELRTAAAFLTLEAARAEKKAKEGLDTSSQELKKLASDLDGGVVVTTKALDRSIAAASKALAVHHNVKAAESWAKKDYRTAAQAVKAASDYVNKAGTWAGHAASTGAEAAWDAATDAGEKTVEAGKDAGEWSADKIQKGIEWTGSAIERLGKAMQE